MALNFNLSYRGQFDQFKTLKTKEEFEDSVLPFVQFTQQIIQDKNHPMRTEVFEWKVKLFNEDEHQLYKHQITAIEGCLKQVVFTKDTKTGYCFMPTSAGKGHILITLAALSVGDFKLFRNLDDAMPGVFEEQPYLLPIVISLSLEYAKLIQKHDIKRTQILVHDVEILKQLESDSKSLLGEALAHKIQYHSVQALGNETRRENLKYVIIDECHWGNASQAETIQSDLVDHVKESGGFAFGFTASPYQHPDGKFQKTWSKNKINASYDFNYYLDHNIIYPVTLQEVNLQNARPDFADSGEELNLTEKSQVVEFMANYIMTKLPETELDGPGICYFNPFVIPDMVEKLLEHRKGKILKGRIKVLASESAGFAEKCRAMFGPDILATSQDIAALKRGEKIFLVSALKLIVGLNAPYLRYVFISPTNSKIKIMQAIGRLMRPVDSAKVPRKLAILFLASLTGKKLDLGEPNGEVTEKEEQERNPIEIDPDADESPATNYTTGSMTLSEAYDLRHKVFYKTEVGFRDFINETLISNPNAVEFVGQARIDKDALDALDAYKEVVDLNRLRSICRSQYNDLILRRDEYICQGKKIIGPEGCDRTYGQVNLEIHHMPPWEFADIVKKCGYDGTIEWHRKSENMQYLVTLCTDCHDLFHKKQDEKDSQESA